MDDSVLEKCNETELLGLARRQGLGQLRHGVERSRLLAIVRGEVTPEAEDLSGSAHTRRVLQDFIQANFERARSQLPGCNGRCTTFPCSEGRHALCYTPNADAVQT